MKSTFALLFLICFLPRIIFGGSNEAKAPSDYRQAVGSPPSIRVFSDEWADFRRLFATARVLRDRINRSVCVLDDYATFVEVPVKTGDTIASVLKSANRDLPWFWQIRIIRRDSIEQTPVGKLVTPKEAELFRSQPISAGDFLIITVHRENDRGDFE